MALLKTLPWDREMLLKDIKAKAPHVKIYLIHGSQDSMVPLKAALNFRKEARRMNVSCALDIVPLDHPTAFQIAEQEDARKAFELALQDSPP